jgi:hypothetical protein
MATQSTSLANLLANTTFESSEPFFMLNNESQYEWTPTQQINQLPDKSTEYFKTDKYTFQAKIQEQINGYTVKIGGRNYGDCINISVYINEKREPINAKLSHIQSEVECSFDTIMKENDTVHFLIASLQFCKQKFPGIQGFELDDMSNIDCGKSKNTTPPRKLEKPFSLAHFSLAKYGETWYELQFGARMINNTLHKIYKDHTKILNQPIQMSFDEFIRKSFCLPNQIPILEQYFSPSKTWHEFFNSIPKHIQCYVLFNWLPEFVNMLISGSFNYSSWVIDVEKVPEMTIQMNVKPQHGGRKKTRRARRRGQYKLILTSEHPQTMNFSSMSV